MPKYKTKLSVVIEAVQFLGTGDSCAEVNAFLGGQHDPNIATWKDCTYDGGFIKTKNGDEEFSPSDYIIKNNHIDGFRVCKQGTFQTVYEKIND